MMTMFANAVRWMALFTGLAGLVACGGDSGGGDTPKTVEEATVARIEGSVIYRERMMLPPGAELEVQLQDISRADAPATVMVSVMIPLEGAPPYAFAIDYDPSTIDSRMRYALRAAISLEDRLMFTTTEYIDPFSGNPVEVMLHRVAESVKKEGPTLEGKVWALQTLAGEPAPKGAGDKPVDLMFSAEDMRAGGFSGCNRYSGSYSREGTSQHGTSLGFGLMAGTMMACADGGEIEQPYLQMLATVTAFRIEGETLSLLAGGEVVASFKPL